MQQPDFWNNKDEARRVRSLLKEITDDISRYQLLEAKVADVEATLELLAVEKDFVLEKEISDSFLQLEKLIAGEEFNHMFSGKYDRLNAIVTIHAGAGGTESCDWAAMLLRMYMMWCEKKGFKAEVVDSMPGDEAGLKNVTMEVFGAYAYGHFRAEKGIHRLVRISPFDSNKRRHTSFASLEAIPEFEEADIEDLVINEEDLRIDTYRASGAGGQHVNKTESAIRITHLPTKIVVSSQIDRSQIKNREIAMKMLRSKLFAYYEELRKEEMEKIQGERKEIGWGHQIRSYVFHPYKMIKDLRTGVERGDIDNVMDGDIDSYIEEYLKQEAGKNA